MIVLSGLFIISATQGQSEAAKYTYFYPYSDGASAEVYKQRRDGVMSALGEKSLLLVLSPEFRNDAGREKYNPNLYYLTGVPEQKSALLISKRGIELNGKKVHQLMILKEQDKNEKLWSGLLMDSAEAQSHLKIEAVVYQSRLKEILDKLLSESDTVYFAGIQQSNLKAFASEFISKPDITLPDEDKDSISAKLRIKYTLPCLTEMRQIKDSSEIALTQKAIDITRKGLFNLYDHFRECAYEYQAEALIEYAFMFGGSPRPAFESIIAGAGNACHMHYNRNNMPLSKSGLLLTDVGASFCNYSADVTRTIPLSGRFSKEQRIIYDIVLRASDSAMALCREGNKFDTTHTIAKRVIARELIKLGILDKEENIKNYFPHGTSHHLGLNVHDVTSGKPLRAGNIITIEPGIYIPEGSNCDQKWWNIGIRIEDDVLITKNDPIVLTAKIPKNPDDIEMILNKPK